MRFVSGRKGSEISRDIKVKGGTNRVARGGEDVGEWEDGALSFELPLNVIKRHVGGEEGKKFLLLLLLLVVVVVMVLRWVHWYCERGEEERDLRGDWDLEDEGIVD